MGGRKNSGVFDSVKLAVEATGANCTVNFPYHHASAPDAMYEAADAGHPVDCVNHEEVLQFRYDARPQLP